MTATDKRYITDVTRRDLEEIAAATNPVAGPGIRIDKTGDSIRFRVDEQQLKFWIWTFLKNGAASATADQVSDIDINYIQEET